MKRRDRIAANGSLQEVHIAVLGMNGSGKSGLAQFLFNIVPLLEMRWSMQLVLIRPIVAALTVKYLTRRYITEYDPNLGMSIYNIFIDSFFAFICIYNGWYLCAEDTYCKYETIHGRQYMIWLMDTVDGVSLYYCVYFKFHSFRIIMLA